MARICRHTSRLVAKKQARFFVMDATAKLRNQLLVVLYHKLKSTNDQIVYIEHMRLLHQNYLLMN